MRTSFAVVGLALFAATTCGGSGANLDDPETLNRVLADAFPAERLLQRGAEERTYLPNDPEPYTGWTKRTYSSGQVRGLARFTDGLLVRQTRWHENGQKSGEGNYENGELAGRWTFWHENGQEAGEGNYENGERVGPWISFWSDNGQKLEEGNYENGERVGLWTFWGVSGQKLEEGNCSEAAITFAQYRRGWTRWHADGRLMECGSVGCSSTVCDR